MDWLARVHLIAETDRVLHANQRKAHRRWTAGLTAKQLGIPASTVSVCVQLERGLDRWPDLASEKSLRRAYDAYRKRLKDANGARRTNGSGHR